MKKYYLFTIFIIIGCLCLADTIQITFPKGSTTVVGAAPQLADKETMQRFALEQSAVFAAKLDYSLCIFRNAHLSRHYDDATHDESATFIVNVVAYVSMLYDYLEYLQMLQERDFHGYQLYFFDLYETDQAFQVAELSDLVVVDIPELIMTGNTVTGVGAASSSQLDIALDEAFKLALSEISKYQDTHIKAMHRSVTDFSEQALLVSSENIVNEVCFSEIYMSYQPENMLESYTVKVLLDKVYP